MKIVVNTGRTVHVVAKAANKTTDGSYARPTVKAHGPTMLIDVPEDDATHLVARGFATKYEPPKAVTEDEKSGK
jgi:hypothetical protein